MRHFLAILFLCASPALAVGEWGLADYGYESRACGFDLDDDFTYGEATGDCDTLCNDANGAGATIVTEDVDGDLEDEQQIYVIPATGTDDADCGGPNNADACATVQYAFENRMNTDADANTEDIICLVGTAHESLEFDDSANGPTGYKTRTATGVEVYDFQYPADPNMIVGADRDGDGSYPPFDTDDTAVFDGYDGASSYLEIFFKQDVGSYPNEASTSRWELAHFTVQEYGINDATRDASTSRGMFHAERGEEYPAAGSEHMYFHDIYGYHNLYGQQNNSSSNMIYELWDRRRLSYHALENIACIECCGYIARGSGAGNDNINNTKEYVRFRNLSVTWYCEDTASEVIVDCCNASSGIKVWGLYGPFEFYNSILDMSVDAWNDNNPAATTQNAFNIRTCLTDVYIVGNKIYNPGVAFAAEAGLAGACEIRNGDNQNFLRNYVGWNDGVENGIGFTAATGDNSLIQITEDVVVANNVFADLTETPQLDQCLYVLKDSPTGGLDPSSYTVSFVNNTCHSAQWGAWTTYGALYFGAANDQSHQYVVENNIISGSINPTTNGYLTRWASGSIIAPTLNYNIYEPTETARPFSALGGQRYASLDLFSAATGYEANGKGVGQNFCDASYVNRGTDFHLDSGDTCAKEAGTSVASYTEVDIDGEARPQDTYWDVGADEVSGSYTPTGACCTDGVCSIETEAGCSGGIWQGAGEVCTPNPCVPPEGEYTQKFIEGVKMKGIEKG